MSNPQDADGWLFEASKVKYCTAIDEQRPHIITPRKDGGFMLYDNEGRRQANKRPYVAGRGE